MTGREAFGGQGGFWAGKARIGKHRTEVTEVTEGERCSGRKLWADRVAAGRETHRGKHRTEVTEVTEGGIWSIKTSIPFCDLCAMLSPLRFLAEVTRGGLA